MTELEFRSAQEQLIDAYADLIRAETHAAACSARRSVGQLLRRDRDCLPKGFIKPTKVWINSSYMTLERYERIHANVMRKVAADNAAMKVHRERDLGESLMMVIGEEAERAGVWK